MAFNNAKEMLEELQVNDLYNEETGQYVFLYSEDGALTEYSISLEEARELNKRSSENDGEYWGAFLGWGGSIIEARDALSYCDDNYRGEWKVVPEVY